MNMASIAILFLFFIVINAHNGNTFVKVECKTGNVGQYGQQSMLECVVQTTQVAKDATIQVVTWKKEGSKDTLLYFNRRNPEMMPGYKFAEPSWNDRNMNISLLITNTEVADDGDYICMVMTDSGGSEGSTSLRVTAKYNKPTIQSSPEKITRNEDVILSCTSDGGYPEGKLRWFDEHNEEWTRNIETKRDQTNNGLFKLSSKLSLLKNSIFSKYTCIVFNTSGGKEDETILEIPNGAASSTGEEGPPVSKITAAVVVIGSLIVGLLLALLVYRRRSLRGHQEVPCRSDAEEGDHPEQYKKCKDSLA